MIRTRVIPVLLLKGAGLYKTVKFADPKYVGDPVNIVRIFNDKEVDELVVLDIAATPEGRGPNFEMIADLASECFMPLAYGGGVRSIEDIRRLLALGVEKVVLNSAAMHMPSLITEAAAQFGSQSIVVCIDVKHGLLGGAICYAESGRRKVGKSPAEVARQMVELGAGEIIVQSIDRDGTMKGYDTDLIERVAAAVDVPVIACGGAGSLDDLKKAQTAGASAVACGAFFVFKGPHRAVLVNVPKRRELEMLLN